MWRLSTSGSMFPTLMAGKRQQTLILTCLVSCQSAPPRGPQRVMVRNRPTSVAASRNGHPPWEAIWVVFNAALQLHSACTNEALWHNLEPVFINQLHRPL